MSSQSKKIYQVAVLLFPGVDLLDFAAPIEMLSSITYDDDSTTQEPAFKIHPIANIPPILASGCLTVGAGTTLEDATKRIDIFDILVVPGGSSKLLQEMATSSGPEAQFIKNFNTQIQRADDDDDERILLSVCTGALLVAATGVLSGLKATTHYLSLDVLKQIDSSIDVVGKAGKGGVGRYVDGGRNANGLRVVTAGGNTCGLDASLYVGELKVGREAAQRTAENSEYNWQRA